MEDECHYCGGKDGAHVPNCPHLAYQRLAFNDHDKLVEWAETMKNMELKPPEKPLGKQDALLVNQVIARTNARDRLPEKLDEIRKIYQANPLLLYNEFLSYKLISMFGAERFNGAVAPVRRNYESMMEAKLANTDFQEFEMRVVANMTEDEKKALQEFPLYRDKKTKFDTSLVKAYQDGQRRLGMSVRARVKFPAFMVHGSKAAAVLQGQEFAFLVADWVEHPKTGERQKTQTIVLWPLFLKEFHKAQGPRLEYNGLDFTQAEIVAELSEEDVRRMKVARNAKRKLDLE